MNEQPLNSRRKFLKLGLYLAPVVMTVAIRPSFANSGYTPPGCGNGGGTGGQQITTRQWFARR